MKDFMGKKWGLKTYKATRKNVVFSNLQSNIRISVDLIFSEKLFKVIIVVQIIFLTTLSFSGWTTNMGFFIPRCVMYHKPSYFSLCSGDRRSTHLFSGKITASENYLWKTTAIYSQNHHFDMVNCQSVCLSINLALNFFLYSVLFSKWLIAHRTTLLA